MPGPHAEQNVIIQAAIHGVSIAGAASTAPTQPCVICTKMLINCGVSHIHYAKGYPDDLSHALLAEAGVSLHQGGPRHQASR